jgi:hypothetical protein
MTFGATADNETAHERRYATIYSCAAKCGGAPFAGAHQNLSSSSSPSAGSTSGNQLGAVGVAGRGGVQSGDRDQHRPPYQRATMSGISPRQTMTKKSGKSLKEKRADKRAKAGQISQTEALLHTKKR